MNKKLPEDNSRLKEYLISKVSELRLKGYSLKQIEKELGYKVKCLSPVLKRFGVSLKQITKELRKNHDFETPLQKLGKKRGVIKPSRYEKLLKPLEQFIKDTGGATSKQIAIEFFGDNSYESKYHAKNLIQRLRFHKKKEGIYFYSVKRKHKFLNEETHLEATEENKSHWKGYTFALQKMVMDGIKNYPELKGDLVRLLGEMNVSLLSGKNINQNDND